MKNKTSSFHPKQRGKSLHNFVDPCGCVCPPQQLCYWLHQQFRGRVSLEIIEGEMSLKFFRVLHQRELGTGTWYYAGEGVPPPP